MKRINLIVILFLIGTACSANSPHDKSFSNTNLSIKVSGSRSFNPNIIHGQIEYYQMTLTGPDLEDPFVRRIDGGAESGKLLGIPVGTQRTITVEAINPNGLVIRRGKKEGVTIVGDSITRIEIAMRSVPIFTNITDKSAVSKRRLTFGVFGEPNSHLEVVRLTGSEAKTLVDQKTGKAFIDTSSDEGLFNLFPSAFGEGTHSFTVRDKQSGEFSTVTVTLYASTVRPGIGVNSGGEIKSSQGDLIVRNAGQFYHRGVGVGDESLGESTMIEVVEAIY